MSDKKSPLWGKRWKIHRPRGHDRKCDIKDCKNEYYAKGLCNLHYCRMLLKGTIAEPLYYRRLSFSDPQKIKEFLLLMRKITPSGCWEWQGCKGTSGYGQKIIDGKMRPTHRLSATVFKGFDINSSLNIRHSCDNPPCFNPDHLSTGTHKDNKHDSMIRDRHCYGERVGTSKFTVNQIRTILEDRKDGLKLMEIVAKFGISLTHASRICRRVSWQHLS